MINSILLAIYLGVGVSSSIDAYIDSEPEDKGNMGYIFGIILGGFIWPIGIIYMNIVNIKKRRNDRNEEEA